MRHRYKTIAKQGKKGKKGQTKCVRVGARNPGANKAQSGDGGKGKGQHGTIRNPY